MSSSTKKKKAGGGKAAPKAAVKSASSKAPAKGAPASTEPEKPIVWKGSSRAKKVFKLFDHDKDKFLNRAEFEEGLRSFVNAPELTLTEEHIEALWLETDWDKDGKISWAEFNHRFCGGPHPSTLVKKVEKKLSLHLQTPRKKEVIQGKNAGIISELKTALEATYDGPKPRYKGVDLSKTKALNQAGLKKLLSQLLTEEKAEAKAAKRALEEWATPLTVPAALDQKNVDRLFAHLDAKKQGKLDLTNFFEQLKLRPAKGGGGKKKKKSVAKKAGAGPQAYVLTTVKAEHVRDFVSETLLRHMPDNVNNSVKCHPPLKHWGDDERKRKALNDEGYRTTIFLSERTKIKAVVKLLPPPEQLNQKDGAAPAAAAASGLTGRKSSASTSRGISSASSTAASSVPPAAAPASASSDPAPSDGPQPNDVLIFAAFRSEYTAMARSEWLWHARITMDPDENIKQVEMKIKKSWVDGELDQNSAEAAFDDWITYVGHEDEFEELSIPPIA